VQLNFQRAGFDIAWPQFQRGIGLDIGVVNPPASRPAGVMTPS
jgi:hypothetical protein